MTLDLVPQEILEHIACFLAADELCGPPSNLVPFLLANRKINRRLSTKNNFHFYATIFSLKFDVKTAKRRLGDEVITSEAMTKELQSRFIVLKRIRSRLDCFTQPDSSDPGQFLEDILATAYLMILENDGNNMQQLSTYAGLGQWLRNYLFHESGASLAVQSIRNGRYPLQSREASLAMWLFWFSMRPKEYTWSGEGSEAPISILKTLALSAHLYNLTNLTWTEHSPAQPTKPAMTVTWYLQPLHLTPPPIAVPATLSFLAVVNRRKTLPIAPSDPSICVPPSDEWRSEWGRAVSSGRQVNEVTDCFVLGSFEGTWEGFFTYTDFSAYAAMLSGASPELIRKSVVGSHQQTWKLREWHLIEPEVSMEPLHPGDPLHSYFPEGATFSECDGCLLVQDPGRLEPLPYHRAGTGRGKVTDVIITGEGHSAWGQFSLTGRVRPCDGFVSLSKDYVNDDRGKWLYRGYLVGNRYGNFVGRWRDTLSSVVHHGYEGCFAMSRRR